MEKKGYGMFTDDFGKQKLPEANDGMDYKGAIIGIALKKYEALAK